MIFDSCCVYYNIYFVDYFGYIFDNRFVVVVVRVFFFSFFMFLWYLALHASERKRGIEIREKCVCECEIDIAHQQMVNTNLYFSIDLF